MALHSRRLSDEIGLPDHLLCAVHFISLHQAQDQDQQAGFITFQLAGQMSKA